MQGPVSENREAEPVKAPKPLGVKAYGSTPHLPGSRMGPGDWGMSEAQAALLTGDVRRKGDEVIVTEKLDGSCTAVAKKNGTLIALQRAGYRADASPFDLHHAFERWTMQRAKLFDALLNDDERVVGEWLHTAMGTLYDIYNPEDLFPVFTIFRGKKRIPYEEFTHRCEKLGVQMVPLLSRGAGISVETALDLLGTNGFRDAKDGIEGAVWVLETDGEFNAIAKFVVPHKVDGKYLSGITNQGDVLNYKGPDF